MTSGIVWSCLPHYLHYYVKLKPHPTDTRIFDILLHFQQEWIPCLLHKTKVSSSKMYFNAVNACVMRCVSRLKIQCLTNIRHKTLPQSPSDQDIFYWWPLLGYFSNIFNISTNKIFHSFQIISLPNRQKALAPLKLNVSNAKRF